MTLNQDEVRRSVVFRMTDDAAVEACQAVCTQVAIGLDVNDQTNKEFV